MTVALEPRSAAWHADRLTTIGASDAPIITGDAPWGDLLTLYAVKTGIIDPPDNENSRTRWGLRLETVVADWFSETTGKRLRRDNTRPRHPEHPWMATSIDRRVVGESSLLEIKTARYRSDEWGTEWSAEIPTHYLIQVQHEMAVTGTDRCYVAVLFAGSDPVPYEVPRDDDLIAGLIDLEAAFMECIRNGTPPDALMQSRRVRAVYRTEEVDADDVLAMGIEGVYNLRSEIKGLKADEDKAAEAVKTLIGGNTVVRAGPFRATYKQNSDSHPVRWELVAAAYRKAIEAACSTEDVVEAIAGLIDLELDTVRELFTETKPGLRLLRITRKDTPDD